MALLKKYFQFITIISIVFSGCTVKMPKDVEQALSQAGKNRSELEKVISHYKSEQEKEKLRAAYFLIGNMPGKYGRYYPENVFYFDLVAKVDSFLSFSPCKEQVDEFIKNYLAENESKNLFQPKQIADLDVITSDYLIENIDLAFMVWKEKPWAKHLNFDEFCEWVLPYRVEDEPLQPWRKYMLEKLEYLEDSIQNPNDPKEICMAINKKIAHEFKFAAKFDFMPMLGGVDLWDTKAGICEHRYLLVTLAMRSMGVPVSIDFTFQYTRWPGNHAWTVLFNNDGDIKPFNGGEKKVKFFEPPNCPVWYEGIASVTTIFRKVYAYQGNSILGQISENLKDQFIQNVSNKYDPTKRGDILIDLKLEDNFEFVNLFAFQKGSEIVAIDWGEIKGGKARFSKISYGGIYFTGYLSGDEIVPDFLPFKWDIGNKISYIKPDLFSNDSIVFYRKYPTQHPAWDYINGMKGAKIQGSNDPDFRNPETIFTITKPDDKFKEIFVNTTKPYRYYRYLSSDSANIRIADIILFFKSADGQKHKLKGRGFGHIPENETCDDGVFENAFDDNIRTNFNAPQGSWLAIDAGKPVKIESFRAIARNHLNIIEQGDTYELFYFDNGWQSLGRKLATDYFVVYNNIPTDALLLLRNITKGQDERIFMIENNEQTWW